MTVRPSLKNLLRLALALFLLLDPSAALFAAKRIKPGATPSSAAPQLPALNIGAQSGQPIPNLQLPVTASPDAATPLPALVPTAAIASPLAQERAALEAQLAAAQNRLDTLTIAREYIPPSQDFIAAKRDVEQLTQRLAALNDPSKASAADLARTFDGMSGMPLDVVLPEPQFAASRFVGELDRKGLEGHAKWWEAPKSERLAAVSRLAAYGDAEAKAALERVSLAYTQDGKFLGSLEDYAVHREALKALAERFGELRSLFPVASDSEARSQVLAEVQSRARLISDIDDTAIPFSGKFPESAGERLKAARAAGKSVNFLTDRPDVADRPGAVGAMESLSTLGAEQLEGVGLATNKGLKLRLYNGGEAKIIKEAKTYWSAAERAALEEARRPVMARYETHNYNGSHYKLDDAGLVIFLKLGTSPSDVEAAAEMLQRELAVRGVVKYDVIGRTPKKPEDPPYLAVSNVNKSWGVRLIDAMAPDAAGARTVLLGDQFMTQGKGRPTDSYMIEGAPKALVIAVGETADPRYGDTILWDKKGPAGWDDILAAFAAK